MDKLKLYGRPDSASVYPIREFLRRSVVDFEWIEIDDYNSSSQFQKDTTSSIKFADGDLVINPTIEQIARHLGWIKKPSLTEYDLSIYGAGPAGLSAAVYAASEGLKTILV